MQEFRASTDSQRARQGALAPAACVLIGVTSLYGGTVTAQAQAPTAPTAASAHAPDRPRVDQTATAASGTGYGVLAGRPRVRAVRTETPPEIDGRLDDEAWRTAAMLTEFVQQSPLDGAPATEQTEVYIAYDRDHIYFGFFLHYADPGIMRANRVDRDTAWQDDLITVYLDTFLDQQRSYDFDLNAYNVQGDGVINTGLQQGGPIPIADRSWDALFHSGTEIVEDGYTAEMAIPFKSFRYPERPPGVEHRWGFQIVREIKGKDQENVVWAPMSRDVRSFMEQMGVLEGMADLSTSRNLEFLPSFTAIRYESIDDATGALINRGTDPEGGLNVKYGITSNLTADFTFNPDFSQIESDLPQIEVNQRFPLFFPELRPFFLEGAEIFNIPSPVNLVHTRTLVDPNLGAKLTGKVGNTTLGVMLADDEAAGRRVEPGERGYDESARVVIGRARYDLYAESHIGAVFTDRAFLDGYSRVGGIDAQFRLGRASRLNFIAVQSQHRDAQGRERSGPMWGALFQHESRNLVASTFAAQIDPDFRTDVGFVQRFDQQIAGANVGYRWWPESWIINWGPRANYQLSFTHEGIREDEQADVGLDFDFARNLRFSVQATQALERYGGIDFHRRNYRVQTNTSTSRLFSAGGNVMWGDAIFYDPSNPYLGRGTNVQVFGTVRPDPRFTTEINVATSRFHDVRAGDVEVFDARIVRALSTLTVTDRLLLRNITEYNSFHGTLGTNLLVTYRINALTVFYAGYDDHYRQGNLIELVGDRYFPTSALQPTNRAFFTKLRVLFRY